MLLLVFSEVQSFRSPVASGLLFGIAPKSNQKGLAPDAVVRFASGNCSCVALPPASMPSRANRTALCFSALRGCADSTSMYCCASAAIHRRAPSGLIRNACDARHRERRVDPRIRASLHCVRENVRVDARNGRAAALAVASAAGCRPTGPPVARRVADDQARRVGARDRADSAAGQGWPVSGTRPPVAQSEGRDARRPRHRGCVSLATFFAQAKKVARSPAGRVEALHLKTNKKTAQGTGLCAAPAAHPSGHSLRECSLRHPAFAVRLSPE